MTSITTYPYLKFNGEPVQVEQFKPSRAVNLVPQILKLIVAAYGNQFEGQNKPLPTGTFAQEYSQGTAQARFEQRTVPGVYARGGKYFGITVPGTDSLAGILKILPGEAIEERFKGMLGIAEILVDPKYQRNALGSTMLHAYLTSESTPPDARLMLDAFTDNPVNTWYKRLRFAVEKPSGVLRLGEHALSTQYMVTLGATATNVVSLLEANRPALTTNIVASQAA